MPVTSVHPGSHAWTALNTALKLQVVNTIVMSPLIDWRLLQFSICVALAWLGLSITIVPPRPRWFVRCPSPHFTQTSSPQPRSSPSTSGPPPNVTFWRATQTPVLSFAIGSRDVSKLSSSTEMVETHWRRSFTSKVRCSPGSAVERSGVRGRALVITWSLTKPFESLESLNGRLKVDSGTGWNNPSRKWLRQVWRHFLHFWFEKKNLQEPSVGDNLLLFWVIKFPTSLIVWDWHAGGCLNVYATMRRSRTQHCGNFYRGLGGT